MKKVGVAILGLGAVGGGAYRVLTEHREFFQKTQHVDLSVESVLEPRTGRLDALGVPQPLRATNIAEVVANPDVNLIVECIGGVDAAKEYCLDALKTGKTVVTSNKELYAKFSHELELAAKRHNAGLYFEGSCVGGVPIVRTLLDGLQSNVITSLVGIVDGTANFILTCMTDCGMTYEEALCEARALGYPASAEEGYDAAYKLSILASLAFHAKVPFAKVAREGVSAISREDIEDGAALGYRVKPLAIARNTQEGIDVRVCPAFVAKEHPLAAVGGTYNAVFVTGDAVGDVMLYGKGAGELPTGSAIVSDIIYAATHEGSRYSTYANTEEEGKETRFSADPSAAYYVRIAALDAAGVLAKVAAVFSKQGISIAKIIRRDAAGKAKLLFVTHETRASAMQAAAAKLKAMTAVDVERILEVVV